MAKERREQSAREASQNTQYFDGLPSRVLLDTGIYLRAFGWAAKRVRRPARLGHDAVHAHPRLGATMPSKLKEA